MMGDATVAKGFRRFLIALAVILISLFLLIYLLPPQWGVLTCFIVWLCFCWFIGKQVAKHQP